MKTITRNHVTIDATDKAMGRIASQIAMLLQGKHKPSYEQHNDHGDSVEVRNVAKVRIAGRNKGEQKTYYNYSGYPGGMRARKLKAVMAVNPSEVLEMAVYRMLPKNSLRKERMKRLKVHND